MLSICISAQKLFTLLVVETTLGVKGSSLFHNIITPITKWKLSKNSSFQMPMFAQRTEPEEPSEHFVLTLMEASGCCFLQGPSGLNSSVHEASQHSRLATVVPQEACTGPPP